MTDTQMIEGAVDLAAPSGVPITERAEDRLEAQVLAEAKALGFRLAIRCSRCGQWLVALESIALHLGPVCRRRAAAEQNQTPPTAAP